MNTIVKLMDCHHYKNDQELLVAFSEGSPPAVEFIFNMYYRKLVYYALKLIGDRAESEDIVVDIFIKVYQKARSFESLANLKAYLYVSVRNTCYDYLKRITLTRKVEGEIKQLADTIGSAPDKQIVLSETMELVIDEIENLPVQCRKIVVLRLVNRYSISEISSHLGISSKTVSNQISIGVKLLRSTLLKKALYYFTSFFILQIYF